MSSTPILACFLCASVFPITTVDPPAPTEGYANRINVYGISIEASNQVEDDWLYYAALVYEHMTNNESRYDVREALQQRGFRILLAGPGQLLTELPEFAHDPEVANAAGLGGNPGEYFIAVKTVHPHVLVHELAHGIYHSAIQFQENKGSIEPEVVEAPPRPGTFTHGLKQAYDAAIASGTWKGTYFEAHPDEYWAEGVTFWFNIPSPDFRDEFDAPLSQSEQALLDSDTRAFLKARDPALYALAASVFPDSDWQPLAMHLGEVDEQRDNDEEDGIIDFARDLQEIARENVKEALSVMDDVRGDIFEEEGPEVVREVFGKLSSLLKNAKLRERADSIIKRLGPDVGDSQPAPSIFEVQPISRNERLGVFGPSLTKYVEVFGIPILATADTSDKKVLHAANIMAEYLDNDEDGEADNAAVLNRLIEEGAFLVMAKSERDQSALRLNRRRIERAGFNIGQDLYDSETRPTGAPHVDGARRFDAALEEVLHLVSNGWREVYPEAFGYDPGTRLTDAMDLARGGRFHRIPRRYPDDAWYHYDDATCDYECMAAEYFYWALTSLLGGQDYPGRPGQIDNEWECPTPALLRERDSAVVELLTDEQFHLPTVLPDGVYSPN